MPGGGIQEEAKSYSIQIQFEGIGEHLVDNKDIIECYLIEDIFSVCMTGKLKIFDQIGLSEYGPLTGNEKITFFFGDQDEPRFIKEITFDIYKISKMTQAMGSQIYARPMWEIFFVDENFKKLTEKRFNKCWPEGPLKASDIWKQILINMAEINNFGSIQEESLEENIKHFFMPWWTPLEAIQWLLKRSKGANFNQPGFLLFSNSMDKTCKLNIATLESLFQGLGKEDPLLYYFETDNMFYRNKILSWNRQGIDQQSMKNLTGGIRLGFDFKTKARLGKNGPEAITFGADSTFSNEEAKFTTLGRKLLYPDISTDPFYKPGFNILTGHNESHYLTDLNSNEWVKRYNLQQSISIICRGFEGEGRHAGSLIKILWPSEVKEELINKNLDGTYLVKSVIHRFARAKPNWSQKMILIKNGYYRPDAPSLKNASKSKI